MNESTNPESTIPPAGAPTALALSAPLAPPAAAALGLPATSVWSGEPGAGPPLPATDVPFAGFWMGGFEGADHVNRSGTPLDMVQASGHLDRLEEDHRRAAQAGLRVVRESIGWRLSEGADGDIDLGRALRVQASARRHGLQVLWTVMHYGLPDGLSLHDDAMVTRLARFAGEVARVLGPGSGPPPVYTPVNEISFLAWAASQPLPDPADGAASHARDSSLISGYQVKRRLARAAIAAMRAMRQADPRARFMHVEPLVHVEPPASSPDKAAQAEMVRSWQWQAWDLIAGRLEPQLGGSPEWLDLVGINHYHSSQWEMDTEKRLNWLRRDPRRRPVSRLLAEAWHRYRRPLVVAETSHVGVGRADWLHDMASEVRHARRAGVPVHGICVYPLVDRPDWEQTSLWHKSGAWHVDTRALAGLRPLPRVAEAPVMAALRDWQRVLPAGDPAPARADGRPVLLAFSHRRWDGVRHRGRHLLERLARAQPGWRVVYVEPPRPGPLPRLDHIAGGPDIDVLVPYTRAAEPGFGAAQPPVLQEMLASWLAGQGIRRPLAWLATPMAGPLARSLQPSAVVADLAEIDDPAALDDVDALEPIDDHEEPPSPHVRAARPAGIDLAALAARRGAAPRPARIAPPAGVRARLRAELLAGADLVFIAHDGPQGTGPQGAPRPGAARAAVFQRLPDGVDREAFDRRRRVAGSWTSEEVALLGQLPPGPRLGFAGVIDHRIDLALVAALADARPRWQFVFVGPVCGVELARLPSRPNLHWLGRQPQRLLPELMAGWQVALLPLLRRGAASAWPLQALEALAAGLPLVATGLPKADAWRPAGALAIDGDHGALGAVLDACDAVLAETDLERARRQRAARDVLRGRDWAQVATACGRMLRALLAAHAAEAPVDAVRPVAPAVSASFQASSMPPPRLPIQPPSASPLAP